MVQSGLRSIRELKPISPRHLNLRRRVHFRRLRICLRMSTPNNNRRPLRYVDALREAVSQEMEFDSRVFVFGLDVDDHKGIQGSTLGLREKFGAGRVFTTPLSE